MSDIVYKEESFKIIGACMRVHSGLGSGFLEVVYQEVLEEEFLKSDIPFQRQVKLSLTYNGEKLKKILHSRFCLF